MAFCQNSGIQPHQHEALDQFIAQSHLNSTTTMRQFLETLFRAFGLFEVPSEGENQLFASTQMILTLLQPNLPTSSKTSNAFFLTFKRTLERFISDTSWVAALLSLSKNDIIESWLFIKWKAANQLLLYISRASFLIFTRRSFDRIEFSKFFAKFSEGKAKGRLFVDLFALPLIDLLQNFFLFEGKVGSNDLFKADWRPSKHFHHRISDRLGLNVLVVNAGVDPAHWSANPPLIRGLIEVGVFHKDEGLDGDKYLE